MKSLYILPFAPFSHIPSYYWSTIKALKLIFKGLIALNLGKTLINKLNICQIKSRRRRKGGGGGTGMRQGWTRGEGGGGYVMGREIRVYLHCPTRLPLFFGGGAASLESLSSLTLGRPNCGLLRSQAWLSRPCCSCPLLSCSALLGSLRLPGSWLGCVVLTGLAFLSWRIKLMTDVGRFWLVAFPPSLLSSGAKIATKMTSL